MVALDVDGCVETEGAPNVGVIDVDGCVDVDGCMDVDGCLDVDASVDDDG
jgi:hypothetical protein